MSPPPFWSKATIQAAVEAWVDQHGRPPTYFEWRSAGYGHPCADTVRRLFGSFGKALASVGYGVKTGGYGPVWTRDRIAAAVLRWRLEHGRWPTAREWCEPAGNPRMGRTDRPHTSTVVRVCGSWMAAQRLAGRVCAPTHREKQLARREGWKNERRQRQRREAAWV